MSSWSDIESIKQYVQATYPNNVTIMVTGANCGIGYQTALAFAKIGCQLIITCRDIQKCFETCSKLQQESGNSNISYIELELSSYESIDNFYSRYEQLNIQVDVLLNNAGISLVSQYTSSQYNQEMNFQINFLSTIRFTEGFIPYLLKSSHPVLLFTTSLSINDVHFKEISDSFLHLSKQEYQWYKAYSRSKFCLTAYAMSLAKREPNLTILLPDPGVVATNIARQSCLSGIYKSWLCQLLFPINQCIYNNVFCALNLEAQQKNCTRYRKQQEKTYPKLLQDQHIIDYIYNYTQTLLRNKY